MYLTLVIHYVHAATARPRMPDLHLSLLMLVSEDGEVLELDEFLAFAHDALHLVDLEGAGVYLETLVSQVSVHEASEEHDFMVGEGDAAQLGALGVAVVAY